MAWLSVVAAGRQWQFLLATSGEEDDPMTTRRIRLLIDGTWIGRVVVVAVMTSLFAPGPALADSVIDAAIKPYFVFGGWVAALVSLGIGFFISWPAIRRRRMAVAASQWPTTDGKVISTDVAKRVFKSQDSEFDYFVPQIRYEYTTNGVRRQGDVIRFGLDEKGYFKEKDAREHAARYPLGTTIPVRYDPEAPEYAVLETGQVGLTGKIFAGFIFVGLGFAAIVFAIWSAGLPTR